MSKMTWIVEHDRYDDEIDHQVYPKRKITHEIDMGDVTWDNLVREFLGFLNSSGYIIDPVLHTELAATLSERHYELLMDRKANR